MTLTSMSNAIKGWKREYGEAEFARRKAFAVKASNKAEAWMKSEEGLEVDPANNTERVIQFYRSRIFQISMYLSKERVEQLPKKNSLGLLVFIQDLIKQGIII